MDGEPVSQPSLEPWPKDICHELTASVGRTMARTSARDTPMCEVCTARPADILPLAQEYSVASLFRPARALAYRLSKLPCRSLGIFGQTYVANVG